MPFRGLEVTVAFRLYQGSIHGITFASADNKAIREIIRREHFVKLLGDNFDRDTPSRALYLQEDFILDFILYH